MVWRKQFRRVDGHLQLRTLHAALERRVATEDVLGNRHHDRRRGAAIAAGDPMPVFGEWASRRLPSASTRASRSRRSSSSAAWAATRTCVNAMDASSTARARISSASRSANRKVRGARPETAPAIDGNRTLGHSRGRLRPRHPVATATVRIASNTAAATASRMASEASLRRLRVEAGTNKPIAATPSATRTKAPFWPVGPRTRHILLNTASLHNSFRSWPTHHDNRANHVTIRINQMA